MNIYFSGIGGVGIGPLAMLAQDAGHTISGSDLELSPMAKDLANRGVKVSTDQSGEFMAAINQEKEIDLMVYTAGLPDDHPELKYAQEYSITAVKRHELINQLLEYKTLKLLAVSGTHGKTTTTGMLIWVFQKLDLPLSYSIGTRLSFAPPAKYDPDSEYFVYEADEFDRNMLKFSPFAAIVTSLDYDHPDTYETKQDYKDAFNEFVSKSENAVVWKDSKLSSENTTVVEENNKDITLSGHNRSNATLVYETMKSLDLNINDSELLAAINSFPGTERRFEKLAENLFTDYAHHPVEIASTIAMAKELGKPVIVVYQPHQNIRQSQILSDGGYRRCFEGAEMVYWAPTYRSREDESMREIKPEELIASTSNPEIIQESELNNDLSAAIKQHLSEDKTVIAMSAGDLDAWLRQIDDRN